MWWYEEWEGFGGDVLRADELGEEETEEDTREKNEGPNSCFYWGKRRCNE